MAQAGESRPTGPPVQPVPRSRRPDLGDGGGPDAAQPVRPPRQLRPAQTLRGLPIPDSRSRPRRRRPTRRLSCAPSVPPAASTAAAATWRAALLQLGRLVPASSGQHLCSPAAQARTQPSPPLEPAGPTGASSATCRTGAPTTRTTSALGSGPIWTRLTSRRLAYRQQRPTRHRPTYQQYRLATIEGTRVRAAPGDATQERRPHQLKPYSFLSSRHFAEGRPALRCMEMRQLRDLTRSQWRPLASTESQS